MLFLIDRIQLQTFSPRITETAEAFPKVLASKLQLPQIFLPILQISKGLPNIIYSV